MARWRLQTSHYINVPGTEWEYEETNRDSGKRARTRFPVPAYLNPADPSDQTPPGSGEVYVAHEGSAQRHDVVFIGDPTPDMEPLDDEAIAISKSLENRWAHPIDSLPATGDYSQSLLTKFQRDIDAIASAVRAPNQTVVDSTEFETMKAQLAVLIAEKNEKPGARRG